MCLEVHWICHYLHFVADSMTGIFDVRATSVSVLLSGCCHVLWFCQLKKKKKKKMRVVVVVVVVVKLLLLLLFRVFVCFSNCFVSFYCLCIYGVVQNQPFIQCWYFPGLLLPPRSVQFGRCQICQTVPALIFHWFHCGLCVCVCVCVCVLDGLVATGGGWTGRPKSEQRVTLLWRRLH